jgi:hypothetical protein
MTGEPGAKGAPHPSTDERGQRQDALGLRERERDYLLAWVGENLTLVRRTASGQRVLYRILGAAIMVAWPLMSAGPCSNPQRRRSLRSWWPTCSTSSASRCGPVWS